MIAVERCAREWPRTTPNDAARRTYEASRAWAPWVRAYNERARVTEGWEVVEDEMKAANSLRMQLKRKKAQ